MTDDAKQGERIAKVMARSGVASRRDAERMIVEGRVKVNGKPVTSPAIDILPSDKVTLDGKPIDAPQPARLWLYYKPLGLVTSTKDEKGRQTVFDTLPEGMPRVMSVGRLDLNSEGLLLLTNDGELKRRLELPSTGWLRKYRVRVNGRPNDLTFDPLRRGVTIEGEEFLPMEVTLDKQQGANAWLTVGLREGRNREIRRAMTEVNLIVNRLIRVSYGPFRLNQMKPGEVVEVKRRILREQLGALYDGLAGAEGEGAAGTGGRAAGDRSERPARKPRAEGGFSSGPRAERPYAPRKPRSQDEGEAPRKPRFDREGGGDRGERPARKPRAEGSFNSGPRAERPYAPRKPRSQEEGEAPRKPRFDREGGGDRSERPARKPRAEGGFSSGPRAERPYAPRKPRPQGEGEAPRKPRFDREGGGGDRSERPARKPRAEGGFSSGPRAERPYAPRKPRAQGEGEAPRKPRFDREGGGDRSERPARKPRAEGGFGSGPRAERPYAPRKPRPQGEGEAPRKPRTPRNDGPKRGPKRGPKKPS
ncbi:pseudouridine synthase [Albidovulum sediminis]|uniref:Pseudouridine synthase n=1 Tax=Albidovulum sediminis TaxID=3066345 RepID=A0ABT2NQQ3_9RHOB|nr:pseudouridine synthase [Defluviimonas sediminis]MCT8329810.1 pseudouridine synthase [Defluviimonas sediminis]